MKTTLLLAALIFSVASIASAQSVEDLKIATRSSFSGSPAARNPFWPVNWQKEAPVDTPVVSGAPVAPAPSAPGDALAFFKPENFVVTSISISGLPLAMINGNAYGEGDLIPVVSQGKKVSVQVLSIRDGTVTLGFQGRTISTAIKEAKPLPKR